MTVATCFELLNDYPRPLSLAYQKVIAAREPLARTDHLLELGETLITYLASVAAAEYLRAGRQAEEAQRALRDCGCGNVTCGKWLGLLDACARANDQSILNPNLARSLQDLRSMATFVKSAEIIKPLLLQAPDAAEPASLVDQELRRGTVGAASILGFFDKFVWWRNRCTHGVREGVPLPPRYKASLSELLEAALIETVGFFDCLRRYPLARLDQRDLTLDDRVAHHFVLCRGLAEIPLDGPYLAEKPIGGPGSWWLLGPDHEPHLRFTYGEVSAPDEPAILAAETGELFVEVRGPDEPAEVRVDGQVVGRTGELLSGIALGSHTLQIMHKYFQPAELEVTVTAGEWEPVVVELQRSAGFLTFLMVASSPSDARFTLQQDGQEVLALSRPQKRRVPAGSYSYRVERDGYEPLSGTCDVCHESTCVVQPQLVAVERKPSPLPTPVGLSPAQDKPASAAPADAQQATVSKPRTDAPAPRPPAVQTVVSPAIQAGGSAAPLEVITNSIGMELALIPAGEFLMGSPETEEGRLADREGPQHLVRITQPFYLGVYPVTQSEYERVMGTNPSAFSSTGREHSRVSGQDTSRFPVETVAWEDVMEFCRRLSAQEGVQFFLPSESQWEYACRAGSVGRWCFGEEEDRLSEYAWYGEDWSRGTTHSVGAKKANGWGLYDMHGNVWEWCSDWYGPYDTSPVDDPVGPEAGSARVARGGGWDNGAGICRSAYRGRGAPDFRYGILGFRLAFSSVDQSGGLVSRGVSQG